VQIAVGETTQDVEIMERADDRRPRTVRLAEEFNNTSNRLVAGS